MHVMDLTIIYTPTHTHTHTYQPSHLSDELKAVKPDKLVFAFRHSRQLGTACLSIECINHDIRENVTNRWTYMHTCTHTQHF